MSAKIIHPASNGFVARDGNNRSPWQLGVSPETTGTPSPATEIFDVIVVGAGITGLTAALRLAEAGKKCVVVEAHNAGFGTTGGTSAHINTFADTTYKEAESACGKEGAQLFADAINEGFATIRQNIERYKIACDFEEKTGFVYAEDEKQAKELKDIYEGAKNVGVAVDYVLQAPAAVPFVEALKFPGQAQFHPLKYLKALQAAFISAGGAILENLSVTEVTRQEDIHIVTAGGSALRARHVIYATHIPPGVNILSLRCAPYRSYVLGVILENDNYPDALVYDMQEPYHYFRTHDLDGEKILIAGGNDHKTGHEDPEKSFTDLEAYVRKYYKVASVKYRWSSQYYVPVDGLPYIGRMPGNDTVYCATGYNGNGMMLGSFAGRMLSDIVLGNKSKYEDVFAPGRMKPVAGFREFIKENADVAYQFVASRFSAHEVDYLKRVKKDSGEVVEFAGRKIAVFRDADGAIHALNPVCTHAGCIVNWNNEEKSWDCPCHGARYDIHGNVLNGPANKPLQKLSAQGEEERHNP